MPPKWFILVVLMSLACGGCAVVDDMQQRAGQPADVPVREATPVYARGGADLQRVFRYYRRASTLSAKDLDGEYRQASLAFAAKRSAETQWRVAILLGIPGSAFYDSGRASTLFKELTNEEFHQSAELNDAAYLLYSLLSAQSQLEKKVATATDRLNESQSTNKKLQEQLDALKAIENTLYQRNKAEETPTP